MRAVMRAAVLKAQGNLVIEDVNLPSSSIPAGYVRVKVGAVGLCGSDVHYYTHGRIGDFVLRAPMILGHEIGGTIDAVGEGVSLPQGAVVALEPGIPCGQCRACRHGEYNLCPEVKFFATPPIDGALAEYVLHPAAYTFVAEGLEAVEAALAEPVSVGVYAVRRAGIELGMRVAVVGAGPVGVLTALAAEGQGGAVDLYDIRRDRVEAAEAMGFRAHVIDAGSETEYDVVIDCSGSKGGLAFAESHLMRGGHLVLVGLGTEDDMRLDGLQASTRGWSIYGIFRYNNTFPAAIQLIQQNRHRLAPFIANVIDLETLPSYLAENRHLKVLKTMVRL